jgi:starvation-inducible DNA-binding protein
MRYSQSESIVDEPSAAPLGAGARDCREMIAVLNDLLVDSIHLRDLYRNARRQNTDIDFHSLRQLFDNHYREQLQLVDVLIDRMCSLGGASSIFADNFLHETHFFGRLRGEGAALRWLREILEAHESVLRNARPAGSSADQVWTRDAAVRRVVMINDLQSWSINELLLRRETGQKSILTRTTS